MQLAIEDVDALIQLAHGIEETDALVDLMADLELQLGKVDGVTVQRQRLARGHLEAVDQLIDEWPGMRVIARCIGPDETSQRRTTGAEDCVRIQVVTEECQ